MERARAVASGGFGVPRQASGGTGRVSRAEARDRASAEKSLPVGRPGLAARLAVWLLAAYKRFLSPLLPNACRFTPTCSIYASEAILKYGFLKGSVKALGRLLRCHPFHSGGIDYP